MRRLCGIPTMSSSFLLIIISYASGYQLNEDDDDDGNDDYDYDKEVKRSIPCYSCHFIFQYDHQQGPMNCKDPFTSFGIPQIDCFGPCAKVYRKLKGKSEFELSRNCMPNCKEFRSESESIECCTTELCNGAVAAATFNGSRTLATVFITVFLLLTLLLR